VRYILADSFANYVKCDQIAFQSSGRPRQKL